MMQLFRFPDLSPQTKLTLNTVAGLGIYYSMHLLAHSGLQAEMRRDCGKWLRVAEFVNQLWQRTILASFPSIRQSPILYEIVRPRSALAAKAVSYLGAPAAESLLSASVNAVMSVHSFQNVFHAFDVSKSLRSQIASLETLQNACDPTAFTETMGNVRSQLENLKLLVSDSPGLFSAIASVQSQLQKLSLENLQEHLPQVISSLQVILPTQFQCGADSTMRLINGVGGALFSGQTLGYPILMDEEIYNASVVNGWKTEFQKELQFMHQKSSEVYEQKCKEMDLEDAIKAAEWEKKKKEWKEEREELKKQFEEKEKQRNVAAEERLKKAELEAAERRDRLNRELAASREEARKKFNEKHRDQLEIEWGSLGSVYLENFQIGPSANPYDYEHISDLERAAALGEFAGRPVHAKVILGTRGFFDEWEFIKRGCDYIKELKKPLLLATHPDKNPSNELASKAINAVREASETLCPSGKDRT